jgi:hypothetical protein
MPLTDAELRERALDFFRTVLGWHTAWRLDSTYGPKRLVDLLIFLRDATRLEDMSLMCHRCAGDPRGPGQHKIEKCDAAALRAQGGER